MTANLVPVMSGVASFNTTTVAGSNQAEVQTLALTNASGGTWRVAYNGEVSAPLSPSVAGLTPSVTFNQTFDAMSNRTELRASIGSTADFRNSYTYDTLHGLEVRCTVGKIVRCDRLPNDRFGGEDGAFHAGAAIVP